MSAVDRLSVALSVLLIVPILCLRQSFPPPAADLPAGTMYYVSTAGDDSSPGTISQPWKTIQRAADILLPGDTVTVLEGTYPERVYVTRSGTTSALVTLNASGTVSMRGFTIKSDFIIIRGFDITDTPDDPTDGIGVFVEGTGCVIERNYIHYATRGGILLYAKPGIAAETSNCIVRDNRLYRNAMNGLDVNGQNHLIERNEVWGTIQYHPNWRDPPSWVDADGMQVHGSGHIFRRNSIHDIHYGVPENVNPHIDCFQTFGGDSYPEVASNVVFEQNNCVNLDAQSPDQVGQGFMIESANNLTIRNNLIQAYRDINAVRSTSIQIVNNVLAGAISSSLAYSPMGVSLSESPNVTVENNAFYNIPGHIVYTEDSTSKQGLTIGYNSVYRSDENPLWDSPHPHDLWGVDPLFLDPASGNFQLQASSPLIDAGIARADVPDDYYGTARPLGRGFDIGIHEYRVAQKKAIPSFGYMNDTVIFAIAFLASGSPTQLTDTLPVSFAYVSSDTTCGGTLTFNIGARQVTYIGTPAAGSVCTTQIFTRVSTYQVTTATNTAIVDDGHGLQSASAMVILNGFTAYLPFL